MRSARRVLLLALMSALFSLVASSTAAAHSSLADEIPLPNGFRPEGIAISKEGKVYVGSIPTGAVFRASVRTGEGSVLVDPREGRASIGLKVDRRDRLFVAGGPTGGGFVYSARTGRPLASYTFASAPTFINDVVVTSRAAWFTDSQNAVLYRVPIGRDGRLGGQDDVTALPLTGDYQQVPGFNVNGIDAFDDRSLVIVQSATGTLFNVDTRTGVARRIDLRGEAVPNGDGILLLGRTLYVVQNQLNQVAKIKLTGPTSGRVLKRITDPDFDVPTTIASYRGRLYVVNARFNTPPTPTTAYNAVVVDGR